jgi:hypothetical protein
MTKNYVAHFSLKNSKYPHGVDKNKLITWLEKHLEIAKKQDAMFFPFFSNVYESYPQKIWYGLNVRPIRDILKDYNIKNYKFIMNTTMELYSTDKIDKSDCIFVNFFIVFTFMHSFRKNQKINETWNRESDKALFLMGKIDKLNRLPLLYKLYKDNILDNVIYSLFVTKKRFENAHKMIPIPYDEYKSFVEKHQKKLDNPTFFNNGRTVPFSQGSSMANVLTNGFPFDEKLYQDSCLSIIAETWFDKYMDSPLFITEKTYKPMINKHPFIMACVPGALKYLNNLGFHTFEKYTLIKDYDDIDDDELRLESIVKNVKYFLEIKNEYADEIQKSVDHNFTHLNNLLEIELNKIQNLLDGIPNKIAIKNAWTLIKKM